MTTTTTNPAADALGGIGSTTPSASPANPVAVGTRTPTVGGDPNLQNIIGADRASSGSFQVYLTQPIARRMTNGPTDVYQLGSHGGPMQSLPSTVGSENEKLYHLGPDQLAPLQKQLAEAGFYGSADSKGHFNYTSGVRDRTTVAAYNEWLVTAAREYEAHGTDADTVLDNMIATHASMGDLNPSAKKGSPGSEQVLQIDLSDPHQVSAIGDTVSNAVYGRAMTAPEKDQLMALIQRKQMARGDELVAAHQDAANANTASTNAAIDAGGMTHSTPDQVVATPITNVDPTSTTEDMLRQLHPAEAGAHDYDAGIHQALSFIRGGAQ